MLSKPMANRINKFIKKPFEKLDEKVSRQIDGTVDAVVSHIYKSLASTAGGNFEAFAAVGKNPWLPIDLNGSSITLGRGQNSNLPVSIPKGGVAGNPPDEETQAFMTLGGHFYTVNMIVPQYIKDKWVGRGKGDDAQGDYYIVVPPSSSTGKTYNVYILEFKAGMSHLTMDIKEEQQMLKEKEVLELWYKSMGLSVNVHLYYCPYLTTNAALYRRRHTSANVNYVTLAGLSRILDIPIETMLKNASTRRNFTQNFTAKAHRIRDAATEKIKTDPTISLDQLKAMESKADFNVDFNINVSSSGDYQQRRAFISQELIKRSKAIATMHNTPDVFKKEEIYDELMEITLKILLADRYPGGKPPPGLPPKIAVLKNESYLNLYNWLKKALNGKVIHDVPKETAFRTILEERKWFLSKTARGEYKFPAIPDSEQLKPITPAQSLLYRAGNISSDVNNSTGQLSAINRKKVLEVQQIIRNINKQKLTTRENKAEYAKVNQRIKQLFRVPFVGGTTARVKPPLGSSNLLFGEQAPVISKTLSNKILNIAVSNKKIPLEAAYQRLLINNINKSTLKNALSKLNTSRLNGASQQYIRNLSSGLNLNNN